MSDDNYIYSMYNAARQTPKAGVPAKVDPVKAAARVIGGLKGQNSHAHTFEVNGQMVSVPRTEYITALENQVRELKKLVQDQTTKQTRLIKANNRIMEELRQIKADLANKVDLR